jgi:hypothetical protein
MKVGHKTGLSKKKSCSKTPISWDNFCTFVLAQKKVKKVKRLDFQTLSAYRFECSCIIMEYKVYL